MAEPAKRKIGLGAFYNLLFQKRGFALAPHHYPLVEGLEDPRIQNLLFLAPPGCLSGDTVMMFRRLLPGRLETNGRDLTLAEAYAKFHGLPANRTIQRYDRDEPEVRSMRKWVGVFDLYLPAYKGDRVGYHRVADIVQSGVKPTFTVTASNGKTLRVTAEHPFRVPDGTPDADTDGFMQVKDLRIGSRILVRSRTKYQGGRKPNKERRVLYSIPHHPYATKHITAGKNYRRMNYARAVVEAAMNLMPTDEFVRIVRSDPIRSADLIYLDPGLEVHHRDENPMNDSIDNLDILTRAQHLATHAHEKQKNFGDVLAVEAEIVSIEPYGDEMTYDVVMENPYRNYVAHDFIVHNTGKSSLLSTVYAVWELGHDPSLTILSVSAGEALPQGFMSTAMQVIQHEPVFKELFPTVIPDQQQGWSIQRGLYVAGHAHSDPDASYKAVGVSSKALTGLHAKLIILDDLHDRENASTPESRAQMKQTFYDTLVGRADPQGCRMVAAGRWWAEDDLYQELIQNGDWVVLQLPAERPGNARLWYDISVPHGLECVYTETLEPDPEQDPRSPYVKYRAYYGAVDSSKKGFYWPSNVQKRREFEGVKRRQPRTAAINYKGDMTGGGTGIFAEEDFRLYVPPGDLADGITSPAIRKWVRSFANAEVEEAWDTALGQPQSTSLTAALTGLMVPCRSWHRGEDPDVVGECDFHYDVWLLDLMVRDLNFRELAMALRTRFGLWHPRRVIVEEKQSGVSLLQTFKGTQIPVWGQKVEQGKMERAVNPVVAQGMGQPIPGGAASVQGWAKMGRILVPTDVPWLHGPHGDATIGFMPRITAFTGGVKASDEFDTLVHLVTRAIVRSRQQAYVPGAQVDDQPYQGEAAPFGQETNARAMMDAFRGMAGAAAAAAAGQSASPFEGMCGAPCHHYAVEDNRENCRRHARVTSAISGCQDWARWGSVPKEL